MHAEQALSIGVLLLMLYLLVLMFGVVVVAIPEEERYKEWFFEFARHGPQAIREWSRNYGPINDTTGHIPFDQCSVIDYGDVEWSATDLQTRLEDIYQVFLSLGQSGCFFLPDAPNGI